LNKSPNCAIVSLKEMIKHIPINEGNGIWLNAKIPFKEFRNDIIQYKPTKI